MEYNSEEEKREIYQNYATIDVFNLYIPLSVGVFILEFLMLNRHHP